MEVQIGNVCWFRKIWSVTVWLFAREFLIVLKLSHHVSLNLITEWFQTIFALCHLTCLHTQFSSFPGVTINFQFIFSNRLKFFIFASSVEERELNENYFSFRRRFARQHEPSTGSGKFNFIEMMIKIGNSHVKLLTTEAEIENSPLALSIMVCMCCEWTTTKNSISSWTIFLFTRLRRPTQRQLLREAY